MRTKRPVSAGGGDKKTKRGRGRPRKFTEPAERLVLYVPKTLLEGIRRFCAKEEMEGRKRPTSTDVVLRAVEAFTPLHDFLVKAGLADFRADK